MPFRFHVLEHLQELANQNPTWPAVCLNDQTVTFQELYGRVQNWVCVLQTNGISAGQRVGISISDELKHLEITWAIAACAAASFNIPTFRSESQRIDMATRAGIDHHIIDDLAFCLDCCPPLILDDVPVKTPAVNLGIAFSDENAELLLFSTSGTTSTPKIFARTAGAVVPAILDTCVSFDEMYQEHQRQCILLRTGTVEHDNHRIARFSQVLAGGANAIMAPFTLKDVSAFCTQTRVTIMGMGAYTLRNYLGQQNIQKLPDDVMLVVGGAPIDRETRRQVLEKMTETFVVNYATSELGIVATAAGDDHLKSDNCIGRLAPGVQLSIRDHTNQEVQEGEPGVAFIRTKGSIKTYITGQNGSDDDGWFATGDIISKLPDGCLTFHGRQDNMFSFNGLNVFPEAIEQYLNALPFIAEAVAFGLPSQQHGHLPVAAILFEDNHDLIEVKEILNMCKRQLGLLAPRKIFIRDTLPINSQGKYLRQVLIKELTHS